MPNIDAIEMARLAMQSLESDTTYSNPANINLFETDDPSNNIFSSQHYGHSSGSSEDGPHTPRGASSQMGTKAGTPGFGLFDNSFEAPQPGTTTRGGSIDLEEILRSVEEVYPGQVQTEFTIPIPAFTEEQKREYQRDPYSWTVKYIYGEVMKEDGETVYQAKFQDGRREEVREDELVDFYDAKDRIETYREVGPPSRDSSMEVEIQTRTRTPKQAPIQTQNRAQTQVPVQLTIQTQSPIQTETPTTAKPSRKRRKMGKPMQQIAKATRQSQIPIVLDSSDEEEQEEVTNTNGHDTEYTNAPTPQNATSPAPITNGTHANSTGQSPEAAPQDGVITFPFDRSASPLVDCIACLQLHPRGSCPLRTALPENCPLCHTMHLPEAYGCPHLKSLTYVTRMMEAVKLAPSDENQKAVQKYLVGRKGTLTRNRAPGAVGRYSPDAPDSADETPNATPLATSSRHGQKPEKRQVEKDEAMPDVKPKARRGRKKSIATEAATPTPAQPRRGRPPKYPIPIPSQRGETPDSLRDSPVPSRHSTPGYLQPASPPPSVPSIQRAVRQAVQQAIQPLIPLPQTQFPGQIQWQQQGTQQSYAPNYQPYVQYQAPPPQPQYLTHDQHLSFLHQQQRDSQQDLFRLQSQQLAHDALLQQQAEADAAAAAAQAEQDRLADEAALEAERLAEEEARLRAEHEAFLFAEQARIQEEEAEALAQQEAEEEAEEEALEEEERRRDEERQRREMEEHVKRRMLAELEKEEMWEEERREARGE